MNQNSVNHPTVASAVEQFWKNRQASDPQFTRDQLRQYVADTVFAKAAPESPSRTLRDLRNRGLVNFYVVNRAKSLYKALPLVVNFYVGNRAEPLKEAPVT